MKIVAQPENYSDMLERIFATTVVAGAICTLILASASPAIKTLLDSVKAEAEIGPLKGIKALYVLLPILIAFISRAIRLHDIISHLLRIRFSFDTHYILFLMASLIGLEIDKHAKKSIRAARESAMYKIFYPYAGFAEPMIDKQLIRNALDNWGWFWVAIESGFLFVVTTIILWILNSRMHLQICLYVLFLIAIFLFIQWHACRRSAYREVKAIIDDPERSRFIKDYFMGLIKN